MDFLDVVRGPALAVAVGIFLAGTLWRLGGIWRRPGQPDLSAARAGAPPRWRGALRGAVRGLWPNGRVTGGRVRLSAINGYAFHVGLALLCFGYAPHIAFVQRHTGLGWPALPDTVVFLAAGVTLLSLLLALVLRLSDPVRKLISTGNDWVSWGVTFLPVASGMMVLGEPSASIVARGQVLYRDPVALHLLMFELLLVWFPFGKLMHAFLFPFSRGATGARFSHRGVKL